MLLMKGENYYLSGFKALIRSQIGKLIRKKQDNLLT